MTESSVQRIEFAKLAVLGPSILDGSISPTWDAGDGPKIHTYAHENGSEEAETTFLVDYADECRMQIAGIYSDQWPRAATLISAFQEYESRNVGLSIPARTWLRKLPRTYEPHERVRLTYHAGYFAGEINRCAGVAGGVSQEEEVLRWFFDQVPDGETAICVLVDWKRVSTTRAVRLRIDVRPSERCRSEPDQLRKISAILAARFATLSRWDLRLLASPGGPDFYGASESVESALRIPSERPGRRTNKSLDPDIVSYGNFPMRRWT